MEEFRCTRPTRAVAGLLVSYDGQRVEWTEADGELLIGRENPPSHVQIEHPAVSRLHARLIPGAPWRLVDYDSLNGIYVMGERITGDLNVTDGLTVHLGHPDGVAVTFNYSTEPATEPQPACDPSANVLAFVGSDQNAGAGDTTEALTDDVRRAVINEAIVVSLDVIAAELARLPHAAADASGARANGLRARLDRVDGLLTALSALGAQDTAAAFNTVRGVYERLLVAGSGIAA